MNFADIIKIVIVFIKDSKKFKELEIMYQNAVYILVFSEIAKFADFR